MASIAWAAYIDPGPPPMKRPTLMASRSSAREAPASNGIVHMIGNASFTAHHNANGYCHHFFNLAA